MKNCSADNTPLQRDELCVALPGYRGTFAAHDFNDLDTRWADHELAEYLVGLLMWPRIRKPDHLLLQLPRCKRSEQREKKTSEAYHAMFCHRMKGCGQKLAAVLPTVVLLLVVGVTMLYLSNLVAGGESSEAGSSNQTEDFWHTLSEAIRVGGWVSSWTAVALFFYDGLRTLYRLWIFWRLSRLPIEFCYERRGTSADHADGDDNGEQEDAELPDSRLAHRA